MSEEILVNVAAHETRVAVLDHGVVQELHIERRTTRGLVGNVYLGKVARVLPGMQSAFIEIGLDRAGFLHVADIWEHRHPTPGNGNINAPEPISTSDAKQAPKPIERLLHEGQPLLVQVIKDPIGTKGARLSTQISLAGRLLVYLPQDSHIGISQRIESEAERALLRDTLTHLLPEGLVGGFIVRTMAETANDGELRADIEYLTKLWRSIQARCSQLPAPSQLHQDLSLAERVLRDFVHDQTSRILVDSDEPYQAMHAFAREYTPAIEECLHHYRGERPLFDFYNVEDEIGRALERRVDLKSGGYLIFDQTEAMTTIDVNTGGFVGLRNFDDTVFKTNLEAAQTIARQLRLRNLGGIIIIDFIDMDNAEHRTSVLAELQRALEKDRMRITVNGFTALGLVEMTRKRTRESLAHVLCEPCKSCGSRGEIKSAQTVCYEIMRELAREAKQFNPREFKIMASQSVIDRFLDEDSSHLLQLEEDMGKTVSLHVESLYSQEQYDIVLA